jgi:hypothetical protein
VTAQIAIGPDFSFHRWALRLQDMRPPTPDACKCGAIVPYIVADPAKVGPGDIGSNPFHWFGCVTEPRLRLSTRCTRNIKHSDVLVATREQVVEQWGLNVDDACVPPKRRMRDQAQ